MYFQSVLVQQVVLLVIRELQDRMFAHLTHADLARVEREAPASLASRFTTDAATIREALTRAVNGVGRCGDHRRTGRLDDLLGLGAQPDRRGAAIRSPRCRSSASAGASAAPPGGMQERVGETAALLNESFAQARTVRAYRLEGQETKRAEAAFDRLYRRADER